MKILLIEDDDTIRQLYALYLENIMNDVSVIEAASGTQAIKIIAKDANFDLIAFDADMADGSGLSLYNYSKSKIPNVPFLLLSCDNVNSLKEYSSFLANNPSNRSIIKPFPKNDLENIVLEMFKTKTSTGSAESSSNAQYKKIRMVHFLRFNKVLCDVFLKLSDTKYVKVVSNGDKYSKDVIRKYIMKAQQYLYIKQEDFDSFTEGFSETPFLVEDKDLPLEDIEKAVTASLEIAQDLVAKVGVTSTVTKIVNDSIDQIERDTDNNSHMRQLVKMQRNREDYVSEHSFLVAYIASKICTTLFGESTDKSKKLSGAAFFHDITFTDPQLAYAMDVEESQLDKFDSETVEKAKKHIYDIPTLLKTTSGVPPAVETMVEQHHERQDGKGFPGKVDSLRIFGLSGILNVAHAFVNELYRFDFDEFQSERMVMNVQKSFNEGQYKEASKALAKMILDL